MREHVLAVKPKREDLVDTAGTGGDGASTFNISTAAALVAAAAGAGVAKHGNRAVSSASGSADVLEALGFDLELSRRAQIERSIDELGFGFLFAHTHHPAMRHAAPVRRELGARTVFNVLGPLTNPAGARAQVVGVYAPELVPTIADVLASPRRAPRVRRARRGRHRRALPGRPEPRLRGRGRRGARREIDPADFGVPRCSSADLVGGTPEENAATIHEVFSGAPGPKREAVLLNAAGAIAAAGRAADLAEGYEIARGGRRLRRRRRAARGAHPPSPTRRPCPREPRPGLTPAVAAGTVATSPGWDAGGSPAARKPGRAPDSRVHRVSSGGTSGA